MHGCKYSDDFSSLNQSDDNNNQGNDEQNMNEPAPDVGQ
jgi:hypothetical protein